MSITDIAIASPILQLQALKAASAEVGYMTSEQSRQLKVGDRVCFDGDKADRGTVTATRLRYVIINWDDGHQSFSGHNNDMRRVERVIARKSGK